MNLAFFKSKHTLFDLVTMKRCFHGQQIVAQPENFSGSTTDSKQFSKQLEKSICTRFFQNTFYHQQNFGVQNSLFMRNCARIIVVCTIYVVHNTRQNINKKCKYECKDLLAIRIL